MTKNTDKPVGPGRFSKSPYDVSIAADGKILVRKDDWLSKYSWALYGDYDTLDVFVRPLPALQSANDEIKGIQEIEDVDRIDTGEYLIHVPTYFNWMERQGKPVKPKPQQPTKPENVKTTNWQAANLGALDGTYFLGSAGAELLVFQNLDTGTNYYYVLLKAGAGFGLDPLGKTAKLIKNILRGLGAAFFAGKAATANWEPVQVSFPVSARSLTNLTMRCHGWNFKTGSPKQNWSYEKLTGGTPRFDYFTVTFKENDWIAIPGGSVYSTGGTLIWVW